MNNHKKIIISKNFRDCLIVSVLSIFLLPLMIFLYSKNSENTIFVIFIIFLALLVPATLFQAFINNYKKVIISKQGIVVKNAVVKLCNLSWNDISGIYVYQFSDVEKIKVPQIFGKPRNYGKYNLGGEIVFVPRKKEVKWMFFDDGRGENGENILEYFIPMKKGSIIRLEYNQEVFNAISQFYTKEIIEKSVVVKNFN
ncbi:MAG: hypothetical protein FWB84_06515 [Candidatus Bathyarchaeota archaeon]|uniref:hypothetical protein n=1 Tax=Candidatus Bathycorpusculum sp. TaxID=2994959 RepID=UPI00281981F6|nr:hypothetical protein [Candidatus Termiticorpusculum sp.]